MPLGDEITFRILFVVIYAIFATIRISYRVPAARRSGQRHGMGIAGLLVAIIVLALFTSMGLYIISPEWMRWSQLDLPSLLRWAGVLAAIAIIPLLVWIHRTLGRFYSATLEIRGDHRVVKTGPYSRVRHPMYAVFYTFGVSMGIVSANVLLLSLSLVLVLPLYLVMIREENMLLDVLGDEYREYMAKTGRLLPRLR